MVSLRKSLSLSNTLFSASKFISLPFAEQLLLLPWSLWCLNRSRPILSAGTFLFTCSCVGEIASLLLLSLTWSEWWYGFFELRHLHSPLVFSGSFISENLWDRSESMEWFVKELWLATDIVFSNGRKGLPPLEVLSTASVCWLHFTLLSFTSSLGADGKFLETDGEMGCWGVETDVWRGEMGRWDVEFDVWRGEMGRWGVETDVWRGEMGGWGEWGDLESSWCPDASSLMSSHRSRKLPGVTPSSAAPALQ